MLCKCGIGTLYRRFIKICFHNGGFEVIDLYCLRYAAKVTECFCMAADKRLYTLV